MNLRIAGKINNPDVVEDALGFFNIDKSDTYLYSNTMNINRELMKTDFKILKSETSELMFSSDVLLISDGTIPTNIETSGNVYVYYPGVKDNKQFYLDLDGVFADFEGYFSKIFGEPLSEVEPGKLWKTIGQMMSLNKDVFNSFDVIEGSKHIYDILESRNPIFLTATGFGNVNAIQYQKEEWIRKHLSLDAKILFTKRSSDKSKYASPNAILIDDREHSTIPWVKAGGGVIHHKSNAETISEIIKLINN